MQTARVLWACTQDHSIVSVYVRLAESWLIRMQCVVCGGLVRQREPDQKKTLPVYFQVMRHMTIQTVIY